MKEEVAQAGFSSVYEAMKYNVDLRVDIDGFFSWKRDVYGIGMTTWAIIGLVEVNFMCGILIQELTDGRTRSLTGRPHVKRNKENAPRLRRDQSRQTQ